MPEMQKPAPGETGDRRVESSWSNELPTTTSRPDPASLIETLAALFPAAFISDWRQPHRPLKLGIHQDLIDLGVLRADECRVVFRFYTSRRKYQQALARGGARCDLDGNIAGEVAPDQIDAAKAKLAIIDARLKERAKAKARTRSTLPPPPPPPSALEAPRRLSLADLKRAAQERRQAEAGR